MLCLNRCPRNSGVGCTQRKLSVGAVALLRTSRCASWSSLGSLVWLGSANQDMSSVPPVKLISAEWVEPSWSLVFCLIHSLQCVWYYPRNVPGQKALCVRSKMKFWSCHKGMSNLCLSGFSMTCILSSEGSSTLRMSSFDPMIKKPSFKLLILLISWLL